LGRLTRANFQNLFDPIKASVLTSPKVVHLKDLKLMPMRSSPIKVSFKGTSDLFVQNQPIKIKSNNSSNLVQSNPISSTVDIPKLQNSFNQETLKKYPQAGKYYRLGTPNIEDIAYIEEL
jgi:hypothetical protein